MATAEEFFGSSPPRLQQPSLSSPESPEQPPATGSGNMPATEFFGTSKPTLYQPETEEEKLGFLQRFQQDIDKRVGMLAEIQRATERGEQSFGEGLLQVAGKLGAGAVLDFIGQGVISAGRGLSNITPDIIENPLKDAATGAAIEFMNTRVGQAGLNAAKGGMEQWEQFKEKNPTAARNIEAVVNIGILISPVKKSAKPNTIEAARQSTLRTISGNSPPAEGLSRLAGGLARSAEKQTEANKAKFVDDLVMPKRTAAVKVDQVGRTTESGILRSKNVGLTPDENRISEVVRNVPGVSSSKTLQGNFNAIDKELSVEAGRLLEKLRASPVKISKTEVDDALSLAAQRLEQTPTIVGDAAKTAERLMAEAKRTVASNTDDSAGLLKSRQEFDRFVASQKNASIFDPKMENALSLSVKEVRQTLNNLIDAKNPSSGVKESLARQSSLYRAMDNIAPKAADEYSNAALRAWQNAMRILPFRGEFNQIFAVAAGVGGLGASAMFAPFFTGVVGIGLGAYVAGKAILSPTTKKALSALVRQTDDAVRIATDPDMIRQLRADRALILELLESAEVRTAEGEN